MRALIAEFRRSLKRPESEEWADLYVFRPLGFLFVKAIFRTNITPNQLSLVSMALGVLAGVGFGLGRASALPAAAGLLAVSIVIDCSDGQLARLKANGTPLGRLIDGVADYVVGVAVYLGLGFGYARAADRPGLWWLFLAAAAASNIMHSMIFDFYRNRYLVMVDGSGVSAADDLAKFRTELEFLRTKAGTMFRRLFLRTYIRYMLLQKRLTAGSGESRRDGAAGSGKVIRKNRTALRLWSFLGSSTQGTLLIIAALLGNLTLYLWAMVVGRNLWAVLSFLVQHRIDHGSAEDAA